MGRKLAFFGASVIALGGIAFACGSESPIIVLGPDATPSASPPPSEAGVPTETTVDDIPDGSFLDGADPDALITKDAGGRVDASGCTVCDCDHDGFDRPNCGDGGGQDCDDESTRYRPNQDFVDLEPETGMDGNFNCKNGVEKLYPTNVTCGGLVAGAGCDSAQGFQGDPECGKKGPYVHCTSVLLGLLLCTVGSTENRTQACR